MFNYLASIDTQVDEGFLLLLLRDGGSGSPVDPCLHLPGRERQEYHIRSLHNDTREVVS